MPWQLKSCGVRVGSMLIAALLLSGSTLAQQLGSGTIRVLGIQVDVDTRPDLEGLQPTMTAVKDIPTAVQTVVGVPGLASLPALPPGALVKAELSGPGFGDEVLTLAALPNELMEIPTLAAEGDYYLFNIRLEDAEGNLILGRDPTRDPIVINVIEKLLVTQVTSRALSLEEIREKGIVIDEDNFTALNFTVGLTLGSEQVEIDLPVVIPTTSEALAHVEPPDYTRLPGVQRAFDRINIPNFSLAGFQLRAPPEFEESEGITLPPINGVIVIPGNIGFLNQFFSVVLQATNVAPDASGLVLKNTQATIVLPLGGDAIKGTGDDPLRVAETQAAGVQETLPLLDAVGSDAIVPQATHSAEFLVEGLREGTNTVDFDITGDLFVPALGETVAMTGKAAGLVQVKNPTFSIVLSHPDVVRDGEEYSIFATVTNTSTRPANLFQIALNTRSLSGARLAEDETDVKNLELLSPGQAESFEFRLVARTTGEVTGTVFLADEGVNGSFVLTTGVGDTGIPLSPDTLVLPQTVDYLPKEPDLLFQAVRLLGQAYSVATAPAGTLPPEISRITKSFVFDRAVKLAQAGLHVRFGESALAATRDIAMDYFGGDLNRLTQQAGEDEGQAARLERDLQAFDVLRRAADAGNDFADVLGTTLGRHFASGDIGLLQREWAEAFASRPPHLSFGVSSQGPPVFLKMTDGEGQVLGRLGAGEALAREIPFADRLPLLDTETQSAQLLFAAALTSEAYQFEVAVEEASDLLLSLVLPQGESLVQATYAPLKLAAGSLAKMKWTAEAQNPYRFEVDEDGDGIVDRSVEPLLVSAIEDRPPALVSVRQWAKGTQPTRSPSFEFGDPIGRMLGVLFDEEVDDQTAADALNYRLDDNSVLEVSLQPDRRLAFLILDKPVGPFKQRVLEVERVADRRENLMVGAGLAVSEDPDRGSGGTFAGQVVTADGEPVPYASIKYIQPLEFPSLLSGGCLGSSEVQDFVISTYEADAEGRFFIDYVLGAEFPPDCPSNPDVWLNENNPRGTSNFKLEATDPETGEVGKASSHIHYDGQRMQFKVVIRGYGSIEGVVYDEAGNVVVGGDPGTPESLPVIARNVSTGEIYRSWVDAEGRYAFPREHLSPDGRRTEAPSVVVGNLILQSVRPADAFTAVTSVNLPGAGAAVRQDLVMISPNRYGTVSGRVLEAGGVKGASNVLVQIAGRVLSGIDLYSRSYSSAVVGSTYTDDNGFFRFEQVPIGDIEVRSFRQSSFEQASAKSFLEQGDERSINLIFPGVGGTVIGLVRDAFGNLMAGAKVAGGPTLTETDENGFFEITGLPLGRFTFYARGEDSPALGKVEVETLGPDDVQEVVITLEPTGSIGGTVYGADGVTPVPGQKVQLWVEPERGVIADGYTDNKGEFRFDDYPVADYSVRAVERDHGDGGMVYTAIRFAGDQRDADITFRGLGEIKGRVVQSNGTPAISDVIVTRKVWRVFTASDAVGGPKLFMEVIRKVQQEVDEQAAEQIETALQEAGLSAPGADFFMLVDESIALSSDILGPNGEVTGEFRTSGAAAGPFAVGAFGPFLTPAEVKGEIPKTTDPGKRVVDVGDVVLEPATAQLRGTVFLPDGKTPVGADVSVKIRSLDSAGSVMAAGGGVSQPVLPEYGVVTDDNGEFHFPLVLRGRFVLTADTGVPDTAIKARSAEEIETTRFADAERNRLLNVRLYGQSRGAVPAGETLNVDIRLNAAKGVRVRVVDSDGTTPVPLAKVSLKTSATLDEPEETAFQRINADGNGVVDFFPVIEGRFSVSARHPDGPARGQAEGIVLVDDQQPSAVPITVTLGAVTTADGTVLPAQIFGSVKGTVYRADGAALDNPAQVTVRAGGVSLLTTTDASGRFLAEDVPGGLLSVEAFEPYTARRGAGTGRLAQDGEIAEVPVTLVGLGTATGEVLSSDGSQRMPGLDVILFPTGRFTDRLVTRTDSLGVYSLPGVPLGPYTVRASDPHSVLIGEAQGLMRQDGETITTNIVLEPSGQITGSVYAAGVLIDDKGKPTDLADQPLTEPPGVANAAVTIRGARTTQNVRTDENGKFQSGIALPLGEYGLLVSSPEGNDGATAATTLGLDGEVAQVALALSGAGTVEGVVLDSAGEKPVPHARVTLRSHSRFAGGPVTRFSEKDGSFTFLDVPVGQFSIDVLTTVGEPQLGAAASGALSRHGESLALRDDDEDTEHGALRLQPAGQITGRILLPDGQTPAEGAILALEGRGVRLGRQSETDGAFSFEAVPLGAYRLSFVEPQRNAVAYRRVSLEENGQILELGPVVLDAEAPRVVSTTPAPDTADVSTTDPVVVVLSEPVDPATVTVRTFGLGAAGANIPGRVEISSDGTTLTFHPATALPDLRQVKVLVKADKTGFEGQVLEPGIRDLAGLSLESDLGFSFTTRDATRPQVASTSPKDGEAGVPLKTVVRLEFSEPVDLTSVKSFALMRGDEPVEAALNTASIMGGKVLVLTPRRTLKPDAQYAARIQGPIRDLAGNETADAEIVVRFSTFDTLPPVVQTLKFPDEVSLIEGKTVSLSAVLKDETDVASVEFYRNGELVHTDRQAPYSFKLFLDPTLGDGITVAAVAVDTAGNRSARATLPVTMETNRPPSVSITTPGNMQVSAGQVIALGVAANDDVGLTRVAFMANDGKVASGSEPLRAATTAEVGFSLEVPYDYPVGSQVVVQAVAEDRLGVVTTSTPITLAVVGQLPARVVFRTPANDAAVDPGEVIPVEVQAKHASGIREFSLTAQGAFAFSETRTLDPGVRVATEQFAVSVPEDVSPTEHLTLTARAVDATGSAGTRSVTLRINDRIAPRVVVAPVRASLEVQPGTEVEFDVTASDEIGIDRLHLEVGEFVRETREVPSQQQTGQRFRFTVPADLELGVELPLIARADDRAGNTGQQTLLLLTKDLTGPELTIEAAREEVEAGEEVRFKVLAKDRFGIASLGMISSGLVEQEEARPIDPPSDVTESVFAISIPPEATGGGAVTVRVTATDVAGNITHARAKTFRVTDVIPPRVTGVRPGDGAVDVLPKAGISLTFSEVIAPRSITAETVVVEGPAGVVPGRLGVGYWKRSAGFTPAEPFERGETYTITATTGITDWTGNPLESIFTSRFTTDGTGPRLLELVPAPQSTGLSAAPEIRARFDEALSKESVTVERFSLLDPQGRPVPAEVSLRDGNQTIELKPQTPLELGLSYTLRLSGEMTDAAGNTITDPDGQLIDQLDCNFSTGTFKIARPAEGGEVMEHSVIALEVLGGEGLELPSVTFEVNGKALHPVSGPPYQTRFRVPSLTETQELVITAVGRDRAGAAVARAQASVTVVPRLRSLRPVLGVPLGKVAQWRLELSAPLSKDLAVQLTTPAPDVVTLPKRRLVLPAGKSSLQVPIKGTTEGNAVITATSSQGQAHTVASVSAPVSGIEVAAASSQTLALSVTPSPYGGWLHVPGPGSRSLRIPLLANPALSELPVVVSTSDADILAVSGKVVVPKGSRVAALEVSSRTEGTAALALRIGERLTAVSVKVGLEPPPQRPGVSTRSASVSVRPLPTAGQLWLPQPGSHRIAIPLLERPAIEDLAVAAISDNPSVVEVPSKLRIAAGSTFVELQLSAQEPGAAQLRLTHDGSATAVAVRVGLPPAGYPPGAASRSAGISLVPPAFVGPMLLPRAGVHNVAIPLLAEAADSEVRVALDSSNRSVVSVPDEVAIPAGSQVVAAVLTAGVEGSAEVTFRIGTQAIRLPVTVAAPRPGDVAGISSRSVGVSARPAGTAGTLFMGSLPRIKVRLPLLSTPFESETPVRVVSRNPQIAEVGARPVIVPAGSVVAELTVVAKGRASGESVLDLYIGQVHRTLRIVVGTPTVKDLRRTASPVLGVEVEG